MSRGTTYMMVTENMLKENNPSLKKNITKKHFTSILLELTLIYWKGQISIYN